jgi:ParB family chromosome partitioning protein
MLEVADRIVSHKLTVRDVEKMAKKPAKSRTSAPKRRDSLYDEVELSLTEALGRKVRVVNGRSKGTLEIEFYSLEDLKNIANILGKEQ